MNLKRFFKRSDEDSELSEELESHLAHEIDDNLARGMSPEEARRLAYVKLGNPQRIRDKVWETNRIGWLEDIGRDLALCGANSGQDSQLHAGGAAGDGARHRGQHCDLQFS